MAIPIVRVTGCALFHFHFTKENALDLLQRDKIRRMIRNLKIPDDRLNYRISKSFAVQEHGL